uniref:Uncharacterized protein n=1 Tax=Eutreptiella gymnastica TaxID=73025 RepID=A0A7S4CX58_9EUGL
MYWCFAYIVACHPTPPSTTHTHTQKQSLICQEKKQGGNIRPGWYQKKRTRAHKGAGKLCAYGARMMKGTSPKLSRLTLCCHPLPSLQKNPSKDPCKIPTQANCSFTTQTIRLEGSINPHESLQPSVSLHPCVRLQRKNREQRNLGHK